MRTASIALAAALAAACASIVPTPPIDEVVPGVTSRDDVNRLMGRPVATVTDKRTNFTRSTYDFRNTWGYHESLQVTFDDKGIVYAKASESRAED